MIMVYEHKNLFSEVSDHENDSDYNHLSIHKDNLAEKDLSLESDNILEGMFKNHIVEKEIYDKSDLSLESDNLSELTFASKNIGIGTVETSSLSLESDDLFTDKGVNNDFFENQDRAAGILKDFKSDNWEQLSISEKKEAINQLAGYNADVLGIENKPRIEYYNNEDQGDYGGYSEDDDTIYINEYNMDDSLETADTISHEYRHKHQHERAKNPESDMDYQFLDSFNNYIRPEEDFEGYKNQLVERDASEYAEAFKDYINNL